MFQILRQTLCADHLIMLVCQSEIVSINLVTFPLVTPIQAQWLESERQKSLPLTSVMAISVS